MKKMIALFTAAILALGSSFSVYADEIDTPLEEPVVEEYLYTDEISNSLYINNHSANCTSDVDGWYGITTRIIIVSILQKWNGSSWSDYATWYNVYDSWEATLITTKNNLSSGTYRLRTDVTTYSGSSYENITVYSGLKTC